MNSLIDGGAFDDFSKSRLGMKNNFETFLGFAHFDMKDDNIPPITDSGQDIGEMLYLEKVSTGKILSCRLNKIFFKNGYRTFIVTSTQYYELNKEITIEDEYYQYQLKVNNKMTISKYDFLLVKGYFPYKSNNIIIPDDVINCQRKVVRHA